MSLFYPERTVIVEWANLVANLDSLRNYLPLIDERWALAIEGEYSLTAMHPDHDDLAKSAARLFYRIIKNHRFVDGNKRSAVINVYLFVLYNRYSLDATPQELYDYSKSVASGTDPQEKVIESVEKLFSERLTPMID